MTSFHIAEANLSEPQHQHAIVDLIDEYAQIPLILGTPLSEEVRRDLIPGLQSHPTTIVFLAFDRDKAVGVAVCFLGFSTFLARPLINIHDLAVNSAYRGQGVGRSLMEAVERKAKELGCCKLTLEVDEKNHRARGVYEAAGYSESPRRDDSGRSMFLTKPLE